MNSKNACIIVLLCGGNSSRIGKDKNLLSFGEQPLLGFLIDHYSALGLPIYLSTHIPDQYEEFGVPIIRDIPEEQSPLAGILSILIKSPVDNNIIVAGDMPFISLKLIEKIIKTKGNFDVVVPKVNKTFQPLCALYHKNCIGPISEQLDTGNKIAYQFFPHVRVKEISTADCARYGDVEQMFFNINTMTDYHTALNILKNQI